MHLFTWNVDGRERMAGLAFAYLAREAEADFVIATLQEWPWPIPDLTGTQLAAVPISNRRFGSDLAQSSTGEPSGEDKAGTTIILYSRKLILRDSGIDDSGRARIARFALPNGKEITCVALHWHSMDSRSEVVDHYERGGAMALFRHYLDERLGGDTPTVIMGDFNTTAHARDMSSRYCLFALSQMNRERDSPNWEMVMCRKKAPWYLIEPLKPADIGTYFYTKTDSWSVFDHIVLTSELESRVQSAEILTQMVGIEFLTNPKKIPRGSRFASDHLPVVCKIRYS